MSTLKSGIYKIYLLPPAQKAFGLLAPDVQSRLVAALRTLADDPRPIESLKLTPDEGHQVDSGDFRILYRIDEKSRRIYIYKI